MNNRIPITRLDDIPITRLDNIPITILDDIQSSMSPNELVNTVFMKRSIESGISIPDLISSSYRISGTYR